VSLESRVVLLGAVMGDSVTTTFSEVGTIVIFPGKYGSELTLENLYTSRVVLLGTKLGDSVTIKFVFSKVGAIVILSGDLEVSRLSRIFTRLEYYCCAQGGV